MTNETTSNYDIDEIIAHENEHWSKIFSDEKRRPDNKLYSSYWWEDYYAKITAIIRENIGPHAIIAEIGAGSGKATLLLGNSYEKHLIDISSQALDFAKYLAKKLEAQQLKFILANGFDTKLRAKKYDLTWNIGVIEHYTEDQSSELVAEMMRITKSGGFVGIAVPNFKSFHIQKAKMLNHWIFRRIPGYRLDSEQNYKANDMLRIIEKSAKLVDREIASIEQFTIGNPLPMGTPKIFVRTLGRIINSLLPRHRFLLLVLVRLR